MNLKYAALTTIVLILVSVSVSADPILKPRKYHGPIPQASFSFRFGFLGGTDNSEMVDFLDRVASPFESLTNDFDNAVTFDATYMYKVHPQFGFRANISANFIRSKGDGFILATVSPPDSVEKQVVWDFDRTIDVDLYIVEASAIYFFNDAAVSEFQSYFGGGFSIGHPRVTFTEERADRHKEKGVDFSETFEVTKSSVEAGVHGLLGAMYYFTNRFAMVAETRFQLMQSKFPLEIPNETGAPEEVDFIVDYSGFFLSVGFLRAF